MNNLTFEINGIIIPVRACLDFNQEYDKLSSFTAVRTMNGTGIIQGTYTKITTTLSGSGHLPVGLSCLTPGSSHILKCAAPLSIVSVSNVVTLPSARRTEEAYKPFGYAIVDGELIKTPCVIVGHVATLTTVSGASGYQVLYVPQLVVKINPIKETTDIRRGRYSWTLTAEEI